MTPLQVIFFLTSAAVLASGFMVVFTRNLVRAALWLVATLFFVAVVFVLLEAGFLAVVQVVIYIGAIAILFIFAVMLTRRVMQDSGPQTNPNWWVAAIFAFFMFTGLAWMIRSWGGSATEAPVLASNLETISNLGQSLVNPNAYIIPFEVASVLLLAALIGAIVIAWESRN